MRHWHKPQFARCCCCQSCQLQRSPSTLRSRSGQRFIRASFDCGVDQAVGDALSDLLLVEAILAMKQWRALSSAAALCGQCPRHRIGPATPLHFAVTFPLSSRIAAVLDSCFPSKSGV
eukprot:572281-Pleurochrysis_carterae.AAC.1